MSASPLSPIRDQFRALAVAFVPETEGLTGTDWAEVEALVVRLLEKRPRSVSRALVLFVRLLDLGSLVRYRCRLSRLDPNTRFEYLSRLQDSRLTLLRRGVWGVRTLAFLGYYGRSKVRDAIGYRATRNGWSKQRPGGGKR